MTFSFSHFITLKIFTFTINLARLYVCVCISNSKWVPGVPDFMAGWDQVTFSFSYFIILKIFTFTINLASLYVCVIVCISNSKWVPGVPDFMAG